MSKLSLAGAWKLRGEFMDVTAERYNEVLRKMDAAPVRATLPAFLKLEDLSEEESVYVVLHEQGHILCRHFSEGSVMGRDVVQEYEANEFVHYVLEPTVGMKIAVHRKPIILSLSVIIIAVVIIVLIGAINQQKSYYGEYYITETGHKYHQADCIFVKDKTNVRRLTEEEFESGEFDACEICLPD